MDNNIIALSPQGSVRDYTNSQMALIKRTVAADCNDAEFDLFIEAARRVGLDPFRKQIYAVIYSKNSPDKRKMSIITGIDGFRAVAERSGAYRPDENEPEIEYDNELKGDTNPLGIFKATVTAHKFGPDKVWYPVRGVAYWDEFVPVTEKWEYDEDQNKRVPTGIFELSATSNWKRMARIMISKCAEAQAIRKGWPEDLSGIYSPEEMDQAAMVDITPSEAVEEADKEQRLAIINAKDTVAIQWRGGDPIEYVPIGLVADRCFEFIQGSENSTELDWWRRTNQMGLRDFWAKQKSDALAVKAELEKKIEALNTTEEKEKEG